MVIRIGVVGLGAVAQSVHLPLIRRRPDLFSLRAVTDVSPSLVAAVADAFGVSESGRFTSADELIAKADVDAILVCAGGSHEAIVVAALQAGLAVLCEKPLAFSLAEVAAIRAALPQHGDPRLMVGYMKQYDPAVSRAAELLAEIDDVRSVDVSVLHPTGQSQLEFARVLPAGPDVDPAVRAEFGAADDRLREEALGHADDALWRVYAGCLLSSLSHDMSILRRLFGSPESVEHVDIWRQRSGRQVLETGRDALALGTHPPSIRVAGVLQGSTRYLLDWHYLNDYPSYRETVRIIHGAGSLELAFPSPYLLNTPTVLTSYDPAGTAEEKTEFRSIAEAFELQLEGFASMVREGRQPHTGIDGAEQDVLTAQAIIASYARRTGLRLGGELEVSPVR